MSIDRAPNVVTPTGSTPATVTSEHDTPLNYVASPYLTITGTARIVEGGAPAHLKKLAKVMLGSDEHFPPANAPEGLLTRVRIEKVGGAGPWAS